MVFGNLFGQPRIKDGDRGTAVVMSCERATSNASLRNISMQLQVHVANRTPYLVDHRCNVRADKQPSPGERVPVTVDREEPERLRIEWDEVPTARERVRAAHEASLSGGAAGVVTGDGTVHVMTQTIDANEHPEVLAQVTEMLKAQGIDLSAMTGGATVEMGRPMDPQAAEAFRRSMLGMLGAADAGAPAAGGGVDDLVASLERLVKLRDSGALTQAEFEAQKARILGGG